MPTYEYECLPNGHRFEVKQSFKDDAISVCEVCTEPVRKVYSAAGIVFKGSGYYVNDSRTSAKSSTSKAPKDGSSSSGDSSGGSGSDSSSSNGSGSDKSASSAKSSSTKTASTKSSSSTSSGSSD